MGIGKAIALAFAGEGAAVVVGYLGHPEAAREVVEKIESGGGRAIAVRADVRKHGDLLITGVSSDLCGSS